MTPNQPEPGAEAVLLAQAEAIAADPSVSPAVMRHFALSIAPALARARQEGADAALATLRDEVLHNAEGYDNDTVNHYLGLIDSQPTLPTPPPAAQPQPPAGDEREAFEAWWEWWLHAEEPMFDSSEEAAKETAWTAWQARAAKGGTR